MPAARTIGTYYEPFFGGGSVFFTYGPVRAVIADSNAELMNAWSQIRESPTAVWRGVTEISSDSDSYYAVRGRKVELLDPLERAIRFVYLNRYCFNGIYRTNRNDEFNVPYGRSTGAPPSLQAFKDCATRLEIAQLGVADFETTMASARSGDVVYLDPPWQASRATYGEYGYSTHSEVSPERLAATVASLQKRGAFIFLSLPVQHAGMFEMLERVDFSVGYSVASKSTARGSSTEMLLSSTGRESNKIGA